MADLVVAYAKGRPVLTGVSLTVAPQRTLAVVGPSGAGKSTLLKAIAGLVAPRAGRIRLGDVNLERVPPQARRIAMVLQEDALVATMTVRQNLHFALRDRRNANARVEAAARAVHVGNHLSRRPRDLSGGERQRVGIARALLSDPRALLLDEPLAHVDPRLRRAVRDELAGVRTRFEGPIVYVTHDHVEAMSVGDELAVLIDGRIEDCGDPQRVYDAPRSAAAGRALGERAMNVLTVGDTLLGIRAERVEVGASGAIVGTVARRESTGADAYLYVQTELGEIIARVSPSFAAAPGTRVGVDLPAAWTRRFDARTGAARE